MMQAATSAASGRTRVPRIFSLGDRLLHGRVQILQPSRTSERLAAHINVIGYRVVTEVDCIGEGVQRSARSSSFRATSPYCISELSMHTRVKPKAVCEQLRV